MIRSAGHQTPRRGRNGARPRAMPTKFQQYCEVIEETYEFTLSYAAQGRPPDEGGAQGQQLREHLTRCVEAMRRLEPSCAAVLETEQLEPAASYRAFFSVLARDAHGAIAA